MTENAKKLLGSLTPRLAISAYSEDMIKQSCTNQDIYEMATSIADDIDRAIKELTYGFQIEYLHVLWKASKCCTLVNGQLSEQFIAIQELHSQKLAAIINNIRNNAL